MAISSLSTLSTSAYRGGKNLSKSTGLATALNTIINKVNELITNDGVSDTLEVGTVGGGTYYGTSDSWMQIDGTNPPRVSRMQFLDTTLGTYKTVHVDNGVWTVV